MTQASVVNTRLFLWLTACDVADLHPIPPFTATELADQPAGTIDFRAERPTLVDRKPERLTLTVTETWEPGGEPLDDRRLESHGCWLVTASWHLQVGGPRGGRGSERLDVVPTPDADHARVHRHPYGQPNDVRLASELPPPHVWLSALLDVVEAASGGLYTRWDLASEE